ncbi:hypothetical protein OH77DRAFT_939246 [Trametes cingulata]|nr:hypothetical protein OH77DRAFT_939246 [Trametes cingulata]
MSLCLSIAATIRIIVSISRVHAHTIGDAYCTDAQGHGPHLTGSSSQATASAETSALTVTVTSTVEATPATSLIPSGTSAPDEVNKAGRGHAIPLGTIIGIVVGILSLLSILSAAWWYVRRRKRSRATLDSQTASGGLPASLPGRAERTYRSMSFTPLLSRRAGSPAGDVTPAPVIFFPEAMVRQGANGGRAPLRPHSSMTTETLPGYHSSLPGYLSWDAKSMNTSEDVWDRKSAESERTDSRVQEPIHHSPDPTMLLHPLRYDTKERLA